MSISKDLEIKISGDKAAFTEKFCIYQNDRGIELNIKVSIPKLQVKRNVSLLSDLEGATCGAIILKPNGDIISQSDIVISDDVIKFTINHELTNDLDEVGIYKVQFHIYDGDDNRITIPPVQFEVKGLLGIIPNTL